MRSALLVSAVICLLITACSKDEKSERFRLLTTPVWSSESFDASGPDTTGIGILVKQLKGDAKFKEDGTGSFGNFTGQWKFLSDETQIQILTQILPPIITDIIQLTAQTLKLSATVTIITHPQDPIDLVMTFKAK
jgi:hypothetical protein